MMKDAAESSTDQTPAPAAAPDTTTVDTASGSDAVAGADMPLAELALALEAVLMTSDRAMPTARLAEVLAGAKAKAITAAIAELNQVYDQTGRSFRIEELAGGWQVLTLPRYADVLARLHKSRTQTRLTPAAMETLAIIAYKQPILRAQIETIRGVASGEVLRGLMERRLVKIVGRAEEIGRPMLYGTTKVFLEMFGLASVKDLPKIEDLKIGA